MPLVNTTPFTVAPVTFWMRALSGSDNDIGFGAARDSSDSVYAIGYTRSEGAGQWDIVLAKYDGSGTLQWQRLLGGATDDFGRAAAVDSSGNVYIISETDSAGAGLFDFGIAKYDSSGAIQWQRALGLGGGSDYEWGQAIAVDSSSNVYVTGRANTAGGDDALIAKYDTNGNIQWQRTLGGATNGDWGEAIATDSSSNVYIAGVADVYGTGKRDALIAKYDTNGVIQWQRALGSVAQTDYALGMDVDSSGNVYIVGNTEPGVGVSNMLIAKYDTSGAIQWQRSLGDAEIQWGREVSVDGTGVYAVGYTTSGGGDQDILIAKYDTSGVIQWQRRLGGGSANDTGNSIVTSTAGSIYVVGNTRTVGGANNNIFIGKLPNDGSQTGTYGAMVYQASSLTDQSLSLTDQSISYTDAVASYTDQSTSLTDQSASLTNSDVAP